MLGTKLDVLQKLDVVSSFQVSTQQSGGVIVSMHVDMSEQNLTCVHKQAPMHAHAGLPHMHRQSRLYAHKAHEVVAEREPLELQFVKLEKSLLTVAVLDAWIIWQTSCRRLLKANQYLALNHPCLCGASLQLAIFWLHCLHCSRSRSEYFFPKQKT